ncbi:MAG: TIGR03000 domain-containing protein [Gemmataceae bacterium]
MKEKNCPTASFRKRRLNNRARVVIDVPADAKLYIDGHLMKTTSARRIFQTPDLVAGQTYFYDLKVEVVREGKTLSETQRVLLRPGYSATASFATMDRAETATARRE